MHTVVSWGFCLPPSAHWVLNPSNMVLDERGHNTLKAVAFQNLKGFAISLDVERKGEEGEISLSFKPF